MSGSASAKHSHCQNCGEPLGGPYCAHCGQHDVDYHRSIGPVVEDALEGLLHFDGKFFRSVRYLFTRPGFLTTEFIAGRRTRYANPLRFYIFASFLFFATGFLTEHRPTPAEKAAAAARAKEDAKSDAGADPAAPETGHPASSWGWLNGKMSAAYSANGHLDRAALSRELRHLLPTMLFLCLPFLALVLKVVYLRSNRLYIEHLIFALHLVALIFLVSLASGLARLLGAAVGDGTSQAVGFVFFLAGAWLVFRSFRVVYGQRRVKTLVKISLVTCAYGAVLMVGISCLALASFYIVSREG